MWEDIYQIYKRINNTHDTVELIASDMDINDATMFINAWMTEHYNDQTTSLEIRRQPMDYGKQSGKE